LRSTDAHQLHEWSRLVKRIRDHLRAAQRQRHPRLTVDLRDENRRWWNRGAVEGSEALKHSVIVCACVADRHRAAPEQL